MIMITRCCDNCKKPLEIFEWEKNKNKKIICLECLKMEEGYKLAESIYQEQLIKYIDYVAERKLEEDFCKYKEKRNI